MSRRNRIATVFGGTGFVGSQIVRELLALGFTVKVATRIPEKAYFLKTGGVVGQVAAVACDYSEASILNVVKGADYVVNAVGILYEHGKKSTFRGAHVDIPAAIAKACRQEKVQKFIHISALGCDKATSKYGKSKLAGEEDVRAVFPRATILRPSIIFGTDDDFFNRFAELSRYLPFLPLIGGGKTKFQPVYVGDVADAAARIISDDVGAYEGRIFHIGGSEVLSFRDIYARLFYYTERKRRLVSLPYGIAKIQAVFLGLLPNPLLTRDQVESLKTDSVVAEGASGLKELGIEPKSLDSVLPAYLSAYRKGGVFAKGRAA